MQTILTMKNIVFGSNLRYVLMLLVVLVNSHAYGMFGLSNDFSGSITKLPPETLEQIIIYLLQQKSSKYASAIPCVSQQWNAIANSPYVIKNLCGLAWWISTDGAKKYKETNTQLLCLCKNQTLQLDDVQLLVSNPYTDLNARHGWLDTSITPERYQYDTPLTLSCKSANPTMVAWLLENNVNPNTIVRTWLGSNSALAAVFTPFGWKGLSDDEVQRRVLCIEILCAHGAQVNNIPSGMFDSDIGFFIRQAIEKCKSLKDFAETVQILVKAGADVNANMYQMLPLHHLIIEKNKDMLTVFMQHANPNPYLKNNTTLRESAYELAGRLSIAWNDNYYIDIIRQYDRGIDWYNTQEASRNSTFFSENTN